MGDNEKTKAAKSLEELNKNARKYNSVYPREIKKAQNYFKKGIRAEAFVGLAQVIEYQLHNFWIRYLINSDKKSQLPRKSLGIPTYAEILWNVGFLTTSEKKNLLDFQKGRNVIVHFTSEHVRIQGHPSDKSVEIQFKKGVKIATEFSKYFKMPEFNFDPKIFDKKSK